MDHEVQESFKPIVEMIDERFEALPSQESLLRPANQGQPSSSAPSSIVSVTSASLAPTTGQLSLYKTIRDEDETNEPSDATISARCEARRLHPSLPTTVTRTPAYQLPSIPTTAATHVVFPLNQAIYNNYEATDEPIDLTIHPRCGTRRLHPILLQTATRASAYQQPIIAPMAVAATGQLSHNQGLLQHGWMQRSLQNFQIQAGQSAVSLPQGVLSSQADSTVFAAAHQQYQQRIKQHSHQQHQQISQQQPRPQAPTQPSPPPLPSFPMSMQSSQLVIISQEQKLPSQMGLLQQNLMQQNQPKLQFQARQAAVSLPQEVLSFRSATASLAAMAATQQKYQHQIPQKLHQQQHESFRQQSRHQVPLPLPRMSIQSSAPVIITQAQTRPSKTSLIHQFKPRRKEPDPNEIEELEQFAMSFRKRRLELGISQEEVSLAILKQYGNDISGATITHFEGRDLSLNRMRELQPLMQRWLDDTEASLSNTHPPQTSTHTTPESVGWRQKKRTNIEAKVRLDLEKAFLQNKKPTYQEISMLADSVSLEEGAVSNWFCNRRQKEKRINPPDDCFISSSPLITTPVTSVTVPITPRVPLTAIDLSITAIDLSTTSTILQDASLPIRNAQQITNQVNSASVIGSPPPKTVAE